MGAPGRRSLGYVAYPRSVTRLQHLGLQRRIMLLVTVGLAIMFAVGGFLGSSAIDEATQLVFRERLATAHSTVAMVERDFDRLADDVSLVAGVPGAVSLRGPQALAEAVQTHVGAQDRYPFFSVVGISVLDEAGRSIGESGAAGRRLEDEQRSALPATGSLAIDRATWSTASETPFVDVTVQVSAPMAPNVVGVVARTISVNSEDSFDPATHANGRAAQGSDEGSEPLDAYNLEIVDADGTTALSVGQGSPPGEPTSHLSAIEPLLRSRTATALLDEGADDPHVMAGVPILNSPLYLILEQPVDVALALPNQLRERLLVLIVAGFLGAWAVAWVTTRRVVKPTEELTSAASRMAQGDLTQPIDVAAYDEVASLAETLELMRLRLLDAQEQLVDVNQDLERRIEGRTARLEYVLRKTISAQEDERHALARELHDETAQTLAALTMALDRARDEMAGGHDSGLERISEAKSIAARLLTETRRLIMGLRPSVLDDLGLGPAIAWYAETLMTERDLQIEVRVDATADRLPRHVEVTLFRIAQEALNNVAKHSAASQAQVGWTLIDDQVELIIEDDGVGFDVGAAVAQAAGSGGVGLAGMQERVALLGGSMTITSHAGRGTIINVHVPVHEETP
jgi:signal transduction histidine kinase